MRVAVAGGAVYGPVLIHPTQVVVTKVWLNDEDVGDRCIAADDEEGWVDLIDDPPAAVLGGFAHTIHLGRVRMEYERVQS